MQTTSVTFPATNGPLPAGTPQGPAISVNAPAGSTTTIDTSRSLFAPLAGDPRAAQASPGFRYPTGPVIDTRYYAAPTAPPQPSFGQSPGDAGYAQAQAQALQFQQQQQYQAQLQQQQAVAVAATTDPELQAYYAAEQSKQVARRRLLTVLFVGLAVVLLIVLVVALSSCSGGGGGSLGSSSAAPAPPPTPPTPEPVFQPFHRIIMALAPTDFDIGGAKNICSFTIRIMQVSIQRSSDSEWISLAPPNTMNWFNAIDLVKVARDRAAIVIADAQGVASAGFSRVRIMFSHLRTNDCNEVFTPGDPPVQQMDFPLYLFHSGNSRAQRLGRRHDGQHVAWQVPVPDCSPQLLPGRESGEPSPRFCARGRRAVRDQPVHHNQQDLRHHSRYWRHNEQHTRQHWNGCAWHYGRGCRHSHADVASLCH
jgi:hypothetical protein